MINFNNTFLNPNEIKGYSLIDMINYIGEDEVVFNNLLLVEDQLAISTNDGVYLLKNGLIGDKISDISGYVTYDNYFNTFFENNNAFKNIKNSNTLIPNSDFLYQIIDEKILVYKKKIGDFFLEGKSIRTFSENYIATYSGIYNYNHVKIDSFPSYSNSHIREFDDKIFINYDGLFVVDSISIKGYYSPVGDIKINNNRIGFALDAVNFEDNVILFTTNGVWVTDFDEKLFQLDLAETDDRLKIQKNPKFIKKYETINHSNDNRVLYYINSRLKLISKDLNIYELNDIKEEIFDIKPFENDFFYLTSNDLKFLKDGTSRTLTKSLDFHTVLPLNENFIALSSNNGLYKFDITKKTLTKLLSYEFNRLALYTNKNKLYAGTTEGYFAIEIQDFINYEPHKNSTIKEKIYNQFLFIIIFLIGGLTFTTLFYFLSKAFLRLKKQKSLYTKIIEFIDENITTVNVDLIKDKFGLSYRQLFNVLKDNPGKTIQKRRKLVLFDLLKKKSTMEYIRKKTGYSTEYIYKLKNNLKKN